MGETKRKLLSSSRALKTKNEKSVQKIIEMLPWKLGDKQSVLVGGWLFILRKKPLAKSFKLKNGQRS